MRKLSVILMVLLFTNVGLVSAQINRGKVLLGASSTLDLVGTNPDLMSMGFSTLKFKSDANDFTESPASKMTSFNLSPQVGFFIIDNLALGLDLNYAYSKEKEGVDDAYAVDYTETLFSAGPFARYYVPMAKVLPFVEMSGSFGSQMSKYDYRNNPNKEESKYETSIMSFGGGIGLAAPLGEKVNFDVLAGYNFLRLKDKDDNENNERLEAGTVVLKVGFSVLFGANR